MDKPVTNSFIVKFGVAENYSHLTKNSPRVYVDFGSKELNSAIGKTMLDPQTGRFMSFQSPIDAMNYMGKTGWEFLQAYRLPLPIHQMISSSITS